LDFERVQHVLKAVAGRFEPFTISLRTFGAFPRWKKPRVLWIGMDEGLDRYKALVSALKQEWKRSKVPGLSSHVQVQPHITIGRWNDIYVNEIEGDMVKDVLCRFACPTSLTW
jgi:2'-5' RNA ligase